MASSAEVQCLDMGARYHRVRSDRTKKCLTNDCWCSTVHSMNKKALLKNRGLRMSDEDYVLVEKAAEQQCLKTAVWMRQVCLLEADRVLGRSRGTRRG